MKRLTVAAIVLLCAPMTAMAKINALWDGPVDVGDGLNSYTVHLISDDPGEYGVVAAWEATFEGDLHQELFNGVASTPTLDLGGPDMLGALSERDSHFLYKNELHTVVTSPYEVPGRMAAINGVCGLARMVHDTPLAQIVVPEGGEFRYSGKTVDAYCKLTYFHHFQLTGDGEILGVNGIYSKSRPSGENREVVQVTDLLTNAPPEAVVTYSVWTCDIGPGPKNLYEQILSTRDTEFFWPRPTTGYGSRLVITMDIPSTGQSFTMVSSVTVDGEIPEPATAVLLLAGAAGALRRRRR